MRIRPRAREHILIFIMTMTHNRNLITATIVFATAFAANAQTQFKYSDFDSWTTRSIQESKIIGGATKVLVEVGPEKEWQANTPYVNQGGSLWANSNIMAKVAGVVKTNQSVYREKRGNGYCARMTTHVEGVKVLGIVNIHVMAAGSMYLGKMLEPITGSKNPFKYLDYGVPYTEHPRAIQFDYKVQLSDKPDRVRRTGFSAVKTVPGKDMPGLILLLQRRWEDEKGRIYAHRIGTLFHRFTHNTDWVNGATFEIHYGNITNESFYKPYMNLFQDGADVKYALNSRGRCVPVTEVEWGSPDETPTHLCVQFASSFGTAYVGAEGTTLWLDNFKMIY